ncbi:DNA-deoxyinosine glycosylase [Ruminococcaceae bacterium OttesenSCG-928-I18]|nr:DNA-deoxyinosine glycosylase [Ruminococcaceae bacterium OttesenSCG-928-I18]
MGEARRGEEKGFAPIYSTESRALILGSYPSPKSFAQGFYYGHPQNRFWPLLAALCEAPPPRSVEEKTRLILEHHLALWDSLERCCIQGASDASIKHPVPNPIGELVKKTRIEAVFCNGAASHTFYRRHCQEEAGIEAVKLPSTSPANAVCGFDCLLAAWAPLRRYLSA